MELWFWDQPRVECEVALTDSLTLNLAQEENTIKFIIEMLLKYLNIIGDNWPKWTDYGRHGNRWSIITFKIRYFPSLCGIHPIISLLRSFSVEDHKFPRTCSKWGHKGQPIWSYTSHCSLFIYVLFNCHCSYLPSAYPLFLVFQEYDSPLSILRSKYFLPFFLSFLSTYLKCPWKGNEWSNLKFLLILFFLI